MLYMNIFFKRKYKDINMTGQFGGSSYVILFKRYIFTSKAVPI